MTGGIVLYLLHLGSDNDNWRYLRAVPGTAIGPTGRFFYLSLYCDACALLFALADYHCYAGASYQ